jgi:hypothetical protein
MMYQNPSDRPNGPTTDLNFISFLATVNESRYACLDLTIIDSILSSQSPSAILTRSTVFMAVKLNKMSGKMQLITS